jgi:hypothetical protein
MVAAAAPAAESLGGRHFIVIFAFEGDPGDPTEAHSFAAFYRGDDLARGTTQPALSISWLPASRIVQPFTEERGRNLSLAETLQLARRPGVRVMALGPYAIRPELYRLALDRVRLLNSGAVRYAMLGTGPDAMNCIVALGSIAEPIGTGMSWGFAASVQIAQHLAPFMPDYPRVDGGAASVLRLDALIPRGNRMPPAAPAPAGESSPAAELP